MNNCTSAGSVSSLLLSSSAFFAKAIYDLHVSRDDLATMMSVAAVGGSIVTLTVATAGVAVVSLLRRINSSVGLAQPTKEMLKEEEPEKNCALFRHLPHLSERLAWRSLGAVKKTPIHRLQLPGMNNANLTLEIFIKREDLSHPEYGGNKVRTLQHQLAVCESRRIAGEKAFQQLVSIGSGGSNQVVATAVHARKLGWDGIPKKNQDGTVSANNINASWFDADEPDMDNTLNMLSVLSFPNVGFTFDWGDTSLGVLGTLRAFHMAWSQKEVLPMMLGGNCAAGILGQVGAVVELAEQIEAGESPDPTRIYLPIGSSCTVSGLIVGTVLVRHLGMNALSDPGFKIIGCNVHDGQAKLDRLIGFHVNRFLSFVPLTITHSVASACQALREIGGPDLQEEAFAFVKTSVELRADAEVVGKYGAHSSLSRAAAQHYDKAGVVTDFLSGTPEKKLWICGHFVAKALQPLIHDMETQAAASPRFMLWMTKSAVQPRGKNDEWSKMQEANDVVKEWANKGKAESTLRPGRFSTVDGKQEDYRCLMTEIQKAK
jgi:1-aminocyclopropane-1-carboxylate deaminase/D-cysteine desulfhydrase-like pyridoxal-dependent ACC family enzyme